MVTPLDYEAYPENMMDELCNEVLTKIEASELKLLNWGFVDVRSDLTSQLDNMLESLSSYGSQCWKKAQQSMVTPEDILQNLVKRCLIFPGIINGQTFYRSRFAETIRLLALLRQRFSENDWQTALRLVSDMRIDVKERAYPRREIEPSELCAELRIVGASHLYIQAIQCLLMEAEGTSSIKLAHFQKEAILRHYGNLHSGKDAPGHSDRALVIGAGTSSGKTKAFYIPAMAEIASTMTSKAFVRALAIYPRIELLKDQFVEAFLEARKLDSMLKKHKPRIITIGTYYSETPFKVDALKDIWNKVDPTKRKVEGWECPFFNCPMPECRHSPKPLVWYKEDVDKEIKENTKGRYGNYARLRCPECHFETESQQLLLTRQQMVNNPPDILFTTTEMLNRRMTKANEHKLFGIDIKNTPLPSMLLLDEIHTYEGLNGAHIAYLLRRWRNARRRQTYEPLCVVGLSATLNNAKSFFAKLTGIPKSMVGYVYPTDADMERQGAEYQVVLKGDPVSGTNLLSTSVQTVMLLGRMLDKSATEPSHGAYGQKTFTFTDKLDVTNRWYHIQKDAEFSKTLSKLRRRFNQETLEIQQKKLLAGQDWSICERIGHNLLTPLSIDLTSSQHRGVKPNANLVIATSALEVGYNDPAVGAVVQHKAPHSLASFLQRKGRAGRFRTMRPWMVVVTSAYGRDRWAFQHAEQLFNPIISDINLPIENYYVRKIQAAFTFMDWLSLELKDEPNCSSIDIWKLLSSEDKGKKEWLQEQRKIVHNLIEEILNGSPRRDKLVIYLQQALSLRNKKDIDAILWDEPRSLFFEVLPTVLRQLESDWQRISSSNVNSESLDVKSWEDNIANSPLPDFVTSTLFSDLKSVEIPIHLPPDPPQTLVKVFSQRPQQLTERKPENLSLLQCLVEFAPGNVSKRYARAEPFEQRQIQKRSKQKGEAHWLALPQEQYLVNDTLAIDKLNITYDDAPRELTIDGQKYWLYRPRAYTLQRTPETLSDSSIALLLWRSHFTSKTFRYASEQSIAVSAGKALVLSRNSPWNNIFSEIRCYMQTTGSWVEIARMATEVRADLRYEGKKEAQRKWLKFKMGRSNAGIGFVNYVDALQFQFHPLDTKSFTNSAAWKEISTHLRPEYFRYKLQQDPRVLAKKLSRFEIDWLWQLELSMLVATAVAKQCSLQASANIVQAQRSSLAKRTMYVIFQSQQIEDNSEEKVGRLQTKLQQLVEEQEIIQSLNECEQVLWSLPDNEFLTWLQQCYASSLGSTIFAAFTHLAPDIDPDDLVMDVEGNTIWISEATPGGVGVITKIANILEMRPYDFDLQMFDTLHYCDRQELATQLQMVADLVRNGDLDLRNAFTTLRQTVDLPKQEATLDQLKSLLETHGIPATRELVVALHANFLRPNSSADSDQLIAMLADFWREEEQRLNCTIDLRVIAVAARQIAAIEKQATDTLQRISGIEEVKDNQIFNVLQSLLWLPCVNSCPDCIEERHLYQELVKPSRTLLLALLRPDNEVVVYGQKDWQIQVHNKLTTDFNVQVSCEQDQLAQCKEYLLSLLIEPAEIGFQFFYPIVERISRSGRQWTIELSIREFDHV